MSMWPSKININQKDGVLSESATQDEILNALLLWDMPLEAYPKEILSAKLVWYIPQELTDDITVDLHLQAFVVPHSDGNYYSFWNKDELPLGNVTLPLKNKKGKYMTGYNHTSATLAWVHAKQILQGQYPMYNMHWLTFQGVSQPVSAEGEEPTVPPSGLLVALFCPVRGGLCLRHLNAAPRKMVSVIVAPLEELR